MKANHLAVAVKLALFGVVAGTLTACGGSSGGSSDGTASSGTSIGAVSGFGSVYVNGTRFRTNGNVKSDDGFEREDQLEKGMIVKVSGSWDDSGEGEANEIEYDDTLRGPLQSASWDDVAKSGELSIAGLVVQLDGQTVFRGATVDQLAANPTAYRVRVSAWPLANGEFRASFVGAATLGSGLRFDDEHEVEIKGVVANHSSAAQTFTINGLQVDYTSALPDDDFSLDEITNGLGVEVEGALVGGVLIAGKIDDEDDFFGLSGDVEIQGAIEGPYDEVLRQFVVNGVTVQVGNTEFEDGLQEADLVQGLLVKVEGRFNSQNLLVAREIEPRDGDSEVEARIESIDRTNETMVVGGVRVALTSSTTIEDDADDTRLRTADLESLQPGDFVEVEGRFRAQDGVLEAVSVERDDPEGEYELDGRVTGNTGSTITVLGLELIAGGLGSFDGFGVGSAVEIDYVRTAGGDYQVIEIEFED
ncbi:DUF5666 domain-containing protein [Marinobacter sp. CHS3-4]|uniref:DUF5666 domain-containing protein n=1 Tax=Marinobacter sp. CHS3-4 TaxID=3045174 RepID=UPI0024B5C112|nr:DUF5666 domain-containing protein [Marinobacter sp. CHS3-4]MDI9244557.1 DUF5666 domain-containing protein [Marinobacter sp. CHS3-4]